MGNMVFSPFVIALVAALGLVLGILSLIAAAFNTALHHQRRGLSGRIAALEEEVRMLKEEAEGRAAEPEPGPGPEPESEPEPAAPAEPPKHERPKAPWQDFVDAYNALADTAADEKRPALCEKFIKDQKIELLVCVGYDTQHANQHMPQYESTQSLKDAVCWAAPVPGKETEYAVVPKLDQVYTQELHDKKGLKETFASNFEKGDKKGIHIRIPAIFHKKGDGWKVANPGVIRLD